MIRRFFKKSLIYSLATAMLLPTWLATSVLTTQHALAASTISSGGDTSTVVNGTGTPVALTPLVVSTNADGDITVASGINITLSTTASAANLKFDNAATVSATVTDGNGNLTDGLQVGLPVVAVDGSSVTVPVTQDSLVGDSVSVTGLAVLAGPAGTSDSFAGTAHVIVTTASAPAVGPDFQVDAQTPSIAQVKTTSSTTIDVTFSEPLLNVSVTDNDFSVVGNTVSPIDKTNNPRVTLNLGTAINSNDVPQISIPAGQGVRDTAGNWLNGPVVAPATLDGIKPTVVSAVASPNPSKAGSVAVAVTFSEPMNTAVEPVVTASGIAQGATTVSKLAYDNTTWMGTFVIQNLSENATATISVSGAQDLAGNVMDSNSSVVSISVDTVAPVVTINSLKTNDTTPALSGNVTDTTAAISVTVLGNTYTATNNGDNTWTLADNTITPALVQGIYDVRAQATDTLGNVGTDTSVNELTIDTTKPVITVSPLNKTIEFGSAYTDDGVSATDNVDGDITSSIVRTGTIDPYKLGDQTIKYNVIDKVGNATTEVTRTVTVAPKSNQIMLETNTTVTGDKTEVIIPSGTTGDATITIPSSVTNATINASAYMTGTNPKTVTLPGGLTIVMGNITVHIPAGTVITGPANWTGIINALQAKLVNGIALPVEANKQAQDVSMWEIGFGDAGLTFSNPVKITFAGQAGRSVGFYKNGVYTPITTVADSSTNPTVFSTTGESKMDLDINADGKNEDLIVWTKHFTQFVTYNQTMLPLVAPSVTVSKVEQNDTKTIHVEWQGTGRGVEKYDIFINGVLAATKTNTTGDDTTVKYSFDSTTTNTGKYEVYVKATRGNDTIQSATQSVEFVAPATVAAPVSPSRAKAAASTPTPAPEVQQPATANAADDSGKIAGQEESKKDSVNWTPWIILFVLIILAGAATGGYFFWFGGEEEIAAASTATKSVAAKAKPTESVEEVAPVEKVEKNEKVDRGVTLTQSTKKKPNNQKKSKRW